MKITALVPTLALLALGACQSQPIQEEEVLALLAAQAEEWNQGDIPGFVGHYSPGLTFLGADGLVRGGDDLVERYQARYPDAGARGTLRLQVLELRPLGASAALLLGTYHLERRESAEGYFTLILERTPDGLRIIHDHTTAAAPAGT